MEELSLEQLRHLRNNDNTIIVDARSTSAYIGWKVDGATRRGHILHSKSLSYKWFHYLEKAVLTQSMKDFKENLLKERISELIPQKNQHIVLYDNNYIDYQPVKEYLISIGYSKISYFNLNNWFDSLVYYPNFSNLVPAEWIKMLIEGDTPPFYDNLGYKIFECSWGPEGIVFLGSHIPSAVQIDSDEFEVPPIWTKKSDGLLIKFLESNGITFNETIVIYSNGCDGAEYKLAMVLKYLGHKKVKILNGGFPAWRIMGYPVERGSSRKRPTSVSDIPSINENIFINTEKAKKILSQNRNQLIDARTWEEYSALTSGYKHIESVGRIPGAKWGGSYNDYKNIDDTIRSYEEVQALMYKHDLPLDDTMYYFCGSAGWGASQISYYSEVYGTNNIKVYEGGWSEWQSDPMNPTENELLTKEK